jgi:threonine dehydratase
MVTIDSLREAHQGLAGIALRTPLVETHPGLWPAGTPPIYLKAEHLQPIGAFKIRGAYTAIRRLSDAQRAKGIVTHSSGNHGLAVSWAARRLGVAATVVVPADAPMVKQDGIRANGAELVTVPDRAMREPTVKQLMAERDLSFVPPYDHPDVIAGQGTMGIEILEQAPAVELLLSPCSGGGMLSGIATAIRALKPAVRVIGVEPAGAAKLTAALAAGRPARIEKPQSIADGLLTPSVGVLPFEQMRGTVREAIQVTEEELIAGVKALWNRLGWRVEPSGAIAFAALLAGRIRPTGPTVAVVSGGNIDPEVFTRLVLS